MLEQIITWTGIVLIFVWGGAMFVTQIQYLIASFRASVGWTLLSFVIPFVGLYVLIKFWEDLKRPFLKQLVVAFGGFILFLGGGMALQAMGLLPPGTGLPTLTSRTATGSSAEPLPAEPADPQKIQEPPPRNSVPGVAPVQPMPAEPSPPTPPAVTDAPSWGMEVAVREAAVIRVPNGWTSISWTLPNLAVATGDTVRSEYVTVQLIDKKAHPTFEVFQKTALQEVLQDIIEGEAPPRSRALPVNGMEAVTYAMGGSCRLPGQAGNLLSARISCIDGESHRYTIVQWRTAAWDEQSVRNFDRLLASFAEVGGLRQGDP